MFDPITDTTNPSTVSINETGSTHASDTPTKTATAKMASNKKRRGKASSVATATPPSMPTRQDKLVDDAMKAGEALNRLLNDSTEKTENQSRDLIRRMLLVRESFEANGAFDEDAFWKFVDHRAGRVRGKLTNRWQRLAKVCVPKSTKAPQVSKLGYVLAALNSEGIDSTTVMDEFDEAGSVAGSERDYTGLDRFVRLYKASIGDPLKSANPFMDMKPRRLVDQAHLLYEALRAKDLLNPKIKDVDDFVTPFSASE